MIVERREMMGFSLRIARVGWMLMMRSYVVVECVGSPVYASLLGLLSVVCAKQRRDREVVVYMVWMGLGHRLSSGVGIGGIEHVFAKRVMM